MPSHKIGKTKNAPLTKVGHTASGSFGSNPDVKARGERTPRDLKK